ncbi:epithelial sodium channel subunit alpha-like [Saccoglossus kowalevskii]|uniref:Amiloride-sensitive sodium channel subunit alpha-like n=1 Tax=Saccoglossus kowalevskii TaxID=10224 RepID=A0ABM0M003_SACKO|nr:PREDICTED: amiloride-sensitive sodium channel subunit alpha-like [Saccoglossus kowalevskii]
MENVSLRRESKQVALRKLFGRMVNNSTAHGIPNAARAESLPRRLFWSVLFMVAVGMFLWQFSDQLVRFIDRPVNVKLNISFSRELTFPAVTVCNQNPIRQSAIDFNQEPQSSPPTQNLNQTLNDTALDEDLGNHGGTNNNTNSPPYNTRRRRQTAQTSGDQSGQESKNDPPHPDGDNGPSAGNRDMIRITEILTALPTSERITLGHQADMFIVNCTWQGEQCYASNFTTFSNSMYGNCFTINGPSGYIDPYWTTSFSGPIYGLSLQLFIEQDEYIKGYTAIAGARIVIHDQDKMPFPEDNGFTIAPGAATSIGIRKVLISREPDPYSDCVEEGDSDYTNIYMDSYDVGYSVQACMKACYQSEVINNCGCADPLYPFPYGVYEACKTSNSTQMYCKALVEYDYSTDGLECDCPQACSDVGFTTETSSAMWPANSYKETLLNYLKGSNKKLESLVGDDLKNGTNSVSENLLRVDIYYQELNYEVIEQEPAYLFSDLGSDFGGLIGLWIGVSILTCFEFLELIFDFCHVFCSKGALAVNRTTDISAVSGGDIFFRDKYGNDPALTLNDRSSNKPRMNINNRTTYVPETNAQSLYIPQYSMKIYEPGLLNTS